MAIGALGHAVVADSSQADAVRELTDGSGAQVVLDFVGEGTVAELDCPRSAS